MLVINFTFVGICNTFGYGQAQSGFLFAARGLGANCRERFKQIGLFFCGDARSGVGHRKSVVGGIGAQGNGYVCIGSTSALMFGAIFKFMLMPLAAASA